MRNLAGLAGLTTGALFLSSCVTLPYESAFNSCERKANDCYRICEDIPDERGYVNCQRYCDRDIDRCFDAAYSAYQSSDYGYGYRGYSPSPWYGRYGTWYPNYGYALSFDSYDRYGYRRRRHNPPRYYGQPRRDVAPPPSALPPGAPPAATPPPTPDDYRRGRRQQDGYRRGGGGRPIAPTVEPPEDIYPGQGGRMMDATPGEGLPEPQQQYAPPPQSSPQPTYDPAPQYSPQPSSPTEPDYSPPSESGEAPPVRLRGQAAPRELEGNIAED